MAAPIIIALDCEMVKIGRGRHDIAIAKVVLVESGGRCILRTFVRPPLPVVDHFTDITDIRPQDLANAPSLSRVRCVIKEITQGAILVGHAIDIDLSLLGIRHPQHLIRDTAYFGPFVARNGGKVPGLKRVYRDCLGENLDGIRLDTLRKAQAALAIYLATQHGWERAILRQLHADCRAALAHKSSARETKKYRYK